MLFLPTQPPLRLPLEGTIVIGRASDSDLRVNDVDTSRRHAKIECRPEAHTLHDLASTNGTFVNGNKISEHVLQAGDRIGIGDCLIAFCEVQAEIEDLANDSAATLFREVPAAGKAREAFRGDLAEIPPYAVIQILELGLKTGQLSIDGDTETGSIWFRHGVPAHAETKSQLGFDAATALVSVSAGSFTFQPTLDTPEVTIEASVIQLLLEASRIQDERDA
jgi:hypothetical protein